MRVLATSCLLVVLSGGLAQAQGLVELSTSWTWPESARPSAPRPLRSTPSNREHSYGAALARALGSKVGGVTRIGQRFHPGHDTNRQMSARGVRVRLVDGLVVERFFFKSEDDAFQYALYGSELGARGDTILEARGRQVVVVRGRGLVDPRRARAVTEAAWGSGLPKPKSEPSIQATKTQNNGLLVASRRPDPLLDAEIDQSFERTRDRVESETPGYSQIAPGEHYRADLGGGMVALLHRDDGVSTVLLARSPEELAQLEQHFQPADEARRSTPARVLVGHTREDGSEVYDVLVDGYWQIHTIAPDGELVPHRTRITVLDPRREALGYSPDGGRVLGVLGPLDADGSRERLGLEVRRPDGTVEPYAGDWMFLDELLATRKTPEGDDLDPQQGADREAQRPATPAPADPARGATGRLGDLFD